MSEITSEIIFRVAELHRTIKEQAAEIGQLKVELVAARESLRLAEADAAKNRERDVLRDCRQGKQRCHECPDTECADNMADEAKTKNQKSIGEGR